LSSRTTRPEFVAGNGLTLADIAMGNSIHGGYAFPIERSDSKNLKTWFDRISPRPGFQAHIKKLVV
jgi:glutathione S-transferase